MKIIFENKKLLIGLFSLIAIVALLYNIFNHNNTNEYGYFQGIKAKPSSKIYKLLLLNDGRVLALKNDKANTSKRITINGELFDPQTKKFQDIGQITGKTRLSSIALNDGRVFFVGADSQSGATEAGVYDLAHKKYKIIGKRVYPYITNNLIKLKGGRILIANNNRMVKRENGKDPLFIETPELEIFDPKTNKFSNAGRLRNKSNGRVTALLNNGDVLMLGSNQPEVYNPNTEQTIQLSLNKRLFSVSKAVPLDNGDALIFLSNQRSSILYKKNSPIIKNNSFAKFYEEVHSGGEIGNTFLYSHSAKTIKPLDAWFDNTDSTFNVEKIKKNNVLVFSGQYGYPEHNKPVNRTLIFNSKKMVYEEGPKYIFKFPGYALSTSLKNGDVLILTNDRATTYNEFSKKPFKVFLFSNKGEK